MHQRTRAGGFSCILLIFVLALTAGAQKSDKPPATPSKPESFWDKVLRYSGISHDASNLRAPGDEVVSGSIWLADINAGTTRKISATGGYRSPIFAPGRNEILALQGANLVQVELVSQKIVSRYSLPSVRKLVGFSLEDDDTVLVLLDKAGAHPAPAVLSMATGKITQLPYDGESSRDLEMIEQLQSWDRKYGNTALYTQRQSKGTLYGSTEWADVYIRRNGGQAVDVSHCDGVNCGEPSLSADGRNVVFIKSDRE
jgi:hypothetical protein